MVRSYGPVSPFLCKKGQGQKEKKRPTEVLVPKRSKQAIWKNGFSALIRGMTWKIIEGTGGGARAYKGR